jgi:hypothetical protein
MPVVTTGGGGSLDDIDPDLNLLNKLGDNTTKNCKYYYSNTLYDEIKPKMANADLSVLHLNIRSLPKIVDILIPTIHASGLNFNIIALSETWLKDTNADCYGIPGYAHEYLTRGDKTGGGVSLFINENWTYTIRNDLNFNDNNIEMLWVEINKDSANTPTNLIFGTMYRRPGSDPTIFNSKVNDTITSILAENKKCMHVGDYNLNLLNSSTHLPTNEFADIKLSHSLFPVINKPTRITSSSATLINNIFTSPLDINNSISGILLWDISDHFPVFHIQFKPAAVKPATYRTSRSFSTFNKNNFTNEIHRLDWSAVTTSNDTQTAYSNVHEIISKAFNKSFPITQTKIGYASKLPWLTEGLKSSIKRKHALHTAYLKHPTKEKKSIYTKFKNKLTQIMRRTEREHYQSELTASKSNMRKSWEIIKQIINKNSKKSVKLPKILINGNLCEDSQIISETFNNFFTNIGPILDKKIPQTATQPLSFMQSNYSINMFLNPTTEQEINKIIDKLKNCSVGWDNLPAIIFKENKDSLSCILTHLVNLSLAQGTFPKELKLANIIPIFKAGETQIVGNYRPVSLLSTVSKVLSEHSIPGYHFLLLSKKYFIHSNLVLERGILLTWQ